MMLVGAMLGGVVLNLGSRLGSLVERRTKGARPPRPSAASADSKPGAFDESATLAVRRPLSRFFFVAALATALHCAWFFFYIWAASVHETGLTGFVSILCFSACLLIGLIYAWSRGVVDVMRDPESN
jgi:NADH:ubiquinone oxidoreductase subunit 3 (subunit A)